MRRVIWPADYCLKTAIYHSIWGQRSAFHAALSTTGQGALFTLEDTIEKPWNEKPRTSLTSFPPTGSQPSRPLPKEQERKRASGFLTDKPFSKRASGFLTDKPFSRKLEEEMELAVAGGGAGVEGEKAAAKRGEKLLPEAWFTPSPSPPAPQREVGGRGEAARGKMPPSVAERRGDEEDKEQPWRGAIGVLGDARVAFWCILSEK